MELLALRSRGWAWNTVEQRQFFEGSPISAGVSAQERISEGAPMVAVEQVELRMVVAAATRLRGRCAEALEQMDAVCDRARAVPVDLRCLAEIQRAEIVNSGGMGLRLIDESFNRMLRFREVFGFRFGEGVQCAMDAMLARSSLVMGDAHGALDWVSRAVGAAACCDLLRVWMALTRAQSWVLLDRCEDALAGAATAADAMRAIGPTTGDMTVWSALAELAWQCGDLDRAWQWATQAIEAAAVRPLDSAPEFMPGDIIWTLGH